MAILPRTESTHIVQKLTYPSDTFPSLPSPHQTDSLQAVIPWLLLLFAYGWWAVIIVYYGLLDASISLGYQFQSFPLVIVSLALIHILKLSLQKQNHLLSTLVGLGLFVSGLLA
jgi:hypothetical protein